MNEEDNEIYNEENNLKTWSWKDKYSNLVLIKRIGVGNQSDVYLHRNIDNDVLTVIKKVKKININHEYQEIRLLLKLSKVDFIPNIYNVIDCHEDSIYNSYIFMEYIKGVELYDLVTKYEWDNIHDLYKRVIFKQIVSAVKFIHDNNVIHRDIKLENIIVYYNHDILNINIKLIDLGLSFDLDTGISNTISGTPAYTSPELINGDLIINKCNDVWALGIILYIFYETHYPIDNPLLEYDLIIEKMNRKVEISDIHSDAKNLLQSIFIEYNERITCQDILESKFLRLESISCPDISNEYSNLRDMIDEIMLYSNPDDFNVYDDDNLFIGINPEYTEYYNNPSIYDKVKEINEKKRKYKRKYKCKYKEKEKYKKKDKLKSKNKSKDKLKSNRKRRDRKLRYTTDGVTSSTCDIINNFRNDKNKIKNDEGSQSQNEF